MNPLWLLALLFTVGLITALILGLFNGLPFLLAEILTGLLLSALAGIIIGWLLNRNFMTRWQTRAEALTTELESRTHELSRQRERITGLEKTLLEKDATYASLKNRQQKLQDEVAALKHQLDTLEKDRAVVYEENQMLHKTLTERDAYIKGLEGNR